MNSYYLTSKFKILYAIIATLLTILAYRLFSPFYICVGIFAAINLSMFFKNIASEKIVISDKGIEYHRLGLTFDTTWKNVREIDTKWFPPFQQEGIPLDPDQIRITEWSTGNYTPNVGLSGRSFIPLSKFSENWRDSELGGQIKQYAPHLFEKERSV